MPIGYRFGDCELWPSARLLRVGGHAVALGGRAFDLLLVLVQQSQQVVSKEELFERVWPGLAVEPNNLQVQVWALRRLLGRLAIVTVARRGYRFALPVQLLPLVPTVPGGTAADAGQRTPAGPALPVWPDWADAPGGQPLLTLVGPDAAVLRQWAEALAGHRHPQLQGGVWRIDAGTLGSSTRQWAVPGADDVLWRQLGRLPGLLLLLDCHQALRAARAMVLAARGAAPGLQLLATSLQPLGLPAERVVSPPMDPPVTGGPPQARPAGSALRWKPRSRDVSVS